MWADEFGVPLIGGGIDFIQSHDILICTPAELGIIAEVPVSLARSR